MRRTAWLGVAFAAILLAVACTKPAPPAHGSMRYPPPGTRAYTYIAGAMVAVTFDSAGKVDSVIGPLAAPDSEKVAAKMTCSQSCAKWAAENCNSGQWFWFLDQNGECICACYTWP
jgi:hypothetical protein